MTKQVKNAVGRMIPETINGRKIIPFKGVGKFKPTDNKAAPRISSCVDFPSDGNKLVKSLKEALVKSDIKSGMTISTHHHFRNGDLIVLKLFETIRELGCKDMVWFPSAKFPFEW